MNWIKIFWWLLVLLLIGFAGTFAVGAVMVFNIRGLNLHVAIYGFVTLLFVALAWLVFKKRVRKPS